MFSDDSRWVIVCHREPWLGYENDLKLVLPIVVQMSVATDSLVSSSSSDDFAALLDAELDSDSSDGSPDQDCSDDEDNNAEGARIKRRKVLEMDTRVEVQGSNSNGFTEKAIEEATTDSCTHPGFLRDMCICCGKRMDDGAGVAFGYIHKDLRLGSDEVSRLRDADVRTLLRNKKLYLVLDLDHTLLNSTRLEDINSEEDYLKSQTDSFEDISKGSLFRLDKIRMMTKLRPYVRTFLQEASNMFEMYIYTMGERAYAIEMAKLLDPGNVYFNSRVISKADCTRRHQKGLDVVLGKDSAVLILDDTEAVWQRHKDNLILMERYHYFSSSCRQFGFNCKSLSELKGDENEADGALATVLGVLKKIHSNFFNPEHGDDFAARDVRQVLRKIRNEILRGCKIVFSRVFSTESQAENHHLWKMAEQLGATCAVEVDSSVTHVVSEYAGTEKSRWAVQNGNFLVHPKWLEAANYLWSKKPEQQFPVELTKSK
ncbi:RNA polymerase II C-terminal domain phosphatase-like 4 isoform X3 [Spinacia oleracea]|uniref:RNA polymerase II C-terminal domain phosphatase-like n=2 Tax=Spinacia oleracea TaxID=3562 RepID=A0A9R0K4D2_SPIOL|nr:RNA polymerase II C-terminal domain phosphatase-like 4 isoform X3 [Spinacia oleracea]